MFANSFCIFILKEEEQLRLQAVKKEHEEQEKQTKLRFESQMCFYSNVSSILCQLILTFRQAEVEKTKAAAAVAVPGPSTLNTTVTLPSSLTANYQITPVCKLPFSWIFGIAFKCIDVSIFKVRVTKKGKLFNPDNYDIADMRSDDSTDDDSRPKKVIPSWARSKLKMLLNFVVHY